MLVGRNGEVLEALQELARLAVMTETGDRTRLMLDVAGLPRQAAQGARGACEGRDRRGRSTQAIPSAWPR